MKKEDADKMDYIRANPFLVELRKNQRIVTRQQYNELREMALKGDVIGAIRGLAEIKAGAEERSMEHGKRGRHCRARTDLQNH